MSEKKIKIGVLGAFRGETMINFVKKTGEAELVAVCDKNPDVLHKLIKSKGVTLYDNFEDFIKHDMDAVILANYANEHAPYAIKCLKAGKHVFSEVLPCASLKEAVELVECVEETGLIYAYGENYCYMPATAEMRRLYQKGVLGEIEYAEGEYVHNCEYIWPSITLCDPEHWRNKMPATYYCTHSLGPIIHITGLRPISVTAFEFPFYSRQARCGAKSGGGAIEMVTLENGVVVKSIHGFLGKDSIWYTLYGSKGRMESSREDADIKGVNKLFVNCDSVEGTPDSKVKCYEPKDEFSSLADGMGHAGSDYYPMHYFIEAIKGNPAEIIDVYEAMDMALPGIIGYHSILEGGIPKKLPDMRKKSDRDEVRGDARKMGKEYPPYSKEDIIIDPQVYERLKDKLNKDK